MYGICSYTPSLTVSQAHHHEHIVCKTKAQRKGSSESRQDVVYTGYCERTALLEVECLYLQQA